MDNVIEFPPNKGDLTDDVVWRIERNDGLALQALGMASAYAAHRPEQLTPEGVVIYATAYLGFLRKACMGTVQ